MKKLNRTRGGFTLIELLVVIAIIGILSSVVLVSLNSARAKGKDTHVIADVNQLRTQLESDGTGTSYNNSFTWSTGGVLKFGGASIVYSQIFADLNSNSSSVVASSTIADGGAPGAKAQLVVVAGTGTGGTTPVTVTGGVVSTTAPVTAYAIYGYLSNGNYFCIDSTGRTNQGAGAATTIVCP